MPPISKPLTIPADEWAVHKDIIRNLYIDQKLLLSAVRTEMENVYDFKASIPQYKRKIKEWHFEKNRKATEWQAVGMGLKRRHLEAADATISSNGMPLSPKRLKRALARHELPLWRQIQGLHARTPEGMVIQRALPPPSLFANIKLPGFALINEFRTLGQSSKNILIDSTSELSIREPLTDKLLPNGIQRQNLLAFFPKQDPDLVPSDMEFTLSRQGHSVDHVLIAYALFLCGNKLMSETNLKNFTHFLLRDRREDLYQLLFRTESPYLRCFEEYLLVYAANYHRYDIVDALKRRGIDLSRPIQPYWPPRTLLQEAIVCKDEIFCRKLIEDGVDVDVHVKSRHGLYTSSPLILAQRYLPDLVDTIISHSKSFGGPDDLPFLVQRGASIDRIRELLVQGADVDAVDEEGRTALQHALELQNLAVAQFLLQQGANIDAVDGKGYTALQNAVQSNAFLIISFLLQHRADIDAVDGKGYTALQNAIKSENFVASNFLLRRGANANGASLERLHKTFRRGTDAEGLSNIIYRSTSPLSLAIATGSIEMCQSLLQNGADVNFCLCQLSTLSHEAFAADKVRLDLSWDLLWDSMGVIEDYSSSHLFSALQHAAMNNATEIIELLLNYGADLDSCHGPPPLMIAIISCHEETVELLLRRGASLDSCSFGGLEMDALQASARQGSTNLISLLLAAGANVNSPTRGRWGLTPLQAAIACGHREAAMLLLKHGADINAPCAKEDGLTCLQAGALQGDEFLVRTLLQHNRDSNDPPAVKGGHTALSAVFTSTFRWSDEELCVDEEFDMEDESNSPRAILMLLIDAGADIRFNGWRGGGINSIPVVAAVGDGEYHYGKYTISLINMLIDQGLDLATPAYFDRRLDVLAQMERTWMRQQDREQIMNLGELTFVQAVFVENEMAARFILRQCFPLSGYAAIRALSLLRPAATWSAEVAEMLWTRVPQINVSYWRMSVQDVDDQKGHGPELVLQRACENGNLDFLKFLVHKGANLGTVRDGHEFWATFEVWTPLQEACLNGRLEAVKFLLEHGCDVNAPAIPERHWDQEGDIIWGRSALQAACESGHLDIVEYLLNYGADVNASPWKERGVTALQAAAIKGYIRIAQMLIAAGADIGAEPAELDGRTAINGAAENGRLDMVKLLLDFYKLKDGESISAICEEAAKYAKREYHWSVVELLENYQREPGSSP